MTTLQDIKNQADSIYQEYDARFAGKPRATRDLAALDDLMGRLTEVMTQARTFQDPADAEGAAQILEMAGQNLETYQTERQAIAQSKSQGPAAEQGAQLATLANLVFAQYYRHFAGQDRRTRDVGLLGELMDQLAFIRDQLVDVSRSYAGPEVADNLQVVRDNLRMYTDERDKITESRQELPNGEKADLFAQLANTQFQVYRDHFAGMSRVSRRPALLERTIAQLENIRMNMKRLTKSGFVSQSNKRNVEIVAENLNMYRNELREIRLARQNATTEQLVGELGKAANDVMALYREEFAGRDRVSRDLGRLTLLCDRLAEVALQMRALQAKEPSEMNERNLGIVLDTATLYEAEYQRIQTAKREAGETTAQA